MKWLVLAVLILVPQSTGRATSLHRLRPVWITQSIKWEEPPAPYNRTQRYGYAKVLYFGSDGKFGMIECVLIKKSDSLAISAGDGQNVYAGEWSEQNGILTVSYRLVSRTVQAVGETLPGPIQTTTIQLNARGNRKAKRGVMPRLNFNGSTYIPTAKLNPEDVTTLLPK